MAAETWPPLTVDRIAVRDGRRCMHCGTTDGLTTQHRARKGLGGRRTAERPSNGVILCGALNGAVEADAAVAAWARDRGWKASAYADTTKVPVLDGVTGEWWLLDDNWHKVRTDPPDDVP